MPNINQAQSFSFRLASLLKAEKYCPEVSIIEIPFCSFEFNDLGLCRKT